MGKRKGKNEVIVKALNVDIKKSKIYVGFTSKYGSAYGEWFGEVEAGQNYAIELDIPAELTWGKDIKEIRETLEVISYDGQFNYLQGILDHLYEDGIVAFRIGPSIVLLETKGYTSAKKGSWVQIKVPEIQLFNINL